MLNLFDAENPKHRTLDESGIHVAAIRVMSAEDAAAIRAEIMAPLVQELCEGCPEVGSIRPRCLECPR